MQTLLLFRKWLMFILVKWETEKSSIQVLGNTNDILSRF